MEKEGSGPKLPDNDIPAKLFPQQEVFTEEQREIPEDERIDVLRVFAEITDRIIIQAKINGTYVSEPDLNTWMEGGAVTVAGLTVEVGIISRDKIVTSRELIISGGKIPGDTLYTIDRYDDGRIEPAIFRTDDRGLPNTGDSGLIAASSTSQRKKIGRFEIHGLRRYLKAAR